MIVNHVEELMQAREWSIRRLAGKAGIEYGSAWKMVRGRTQQFDTKILAGLCRALGVGVGDLLEYREGPADNAPSGAVD